MKKLFSALFILTILAAGHSAFAYGEARVELNCMEIEFDQPAIISENRTLVPVRKIFETLGAHVDWNDASRTAVSQKDGKVVSITVGSSVMYVNDKAVELDVPAKIVNNRTLVPVRAISEAYDCRVEWDADERLVEIFDSVFDASEKKSYSSENGLNFEYFADCELIDAGDGALSLRAGACSMTISSEPAANVAIDEAYLENLRKGLGAFSSLDIKYIRKAVNKNIAQIGCYNKGNTIYYMFANKDGRSYNLAVTVPDGAQRYDAEKLMYIMSTFSKKW